jgi:hypothetical protein
MTRKRKRKVIKSLISMAKMTVAKMMIKVAAAAAQAIRKVVAAMAKMVKKDILVVAVI